MAEEELEEELQEELGMVEGGQGEDLERSAYIVQ